jgi:hypothetical protein
MYQNKKSTISLILAFIFMALIIFQANAAEKGLSIKKSEITSTVKFYPYKSGSVYMEIMAVRAPDGTVRTAFNTCQVCYGSGRGYYKQQGNVVVCQNCGNRFRIEQIEKIKGGCNPVPITKENKIETSDTITILAQFIDQFTPLFLRWKKS